MSDGKDLIETCEMEEVNKVYKILLVNKYDLFHYRGSEVRWLNILKVWSRMEGNFRIDVLVPRYAKKGEVEFDDERIRVYRLKPAIPLIKRFSGIAPFDVLLLDLRLIKFVLRGSYDRVILASFPFPPLTLLVLFVLRKFFDSFKHVKMVVHIDHFPQMRPYSNISTLIKTLFAVVFDLFTVLVAKATMLKKDVITTVSMYIKKKLRKVFKNRVIHVTFNGVDVDVFKPMPWLEQDNVVFSWGGLYPRKGFDLLIYAIALLKERYKKGVICRIAGKGFFARELENIIRKLELENVVTLLGEVPEDKLIKEINKAQVVVIPSLIEGFCLTIVEAMACRKPIIAWDLPPMNEIIVHNYNGILVKPINIEQLANYIYLLLQNNDFREKLASNAFKTALKYTWEKVAERQWKVLF